MFNEKGDNVAGRAHDPYYQWHEETHSTNYNGR